MVWENLQPLRITQNEPLLNSIDGVPGNTSPDFGDQLDNAVTLDDVVAQLQSFDFSNNTSMQSFLNNLPSITNVTISDVTGLTNEIDAINSQFGDLTTTLIDTANTANSAVTIANGAVAATQNITTTQISNNAITSPLIAAQAVVAGKIAAGAVVAGTIATGALDALTVNSLVINGGAINGNTITGGYVQTAQPLLVGGSIQGVQFNKDFPDRIRFLSGNSLETGAGSVAIDVVRDPVFHDWTSSLILTTSNLGGGVANIEIMSPRNGGSTGNIYLRPGASSGTTGTVIIGSGVGNLKLSEDASTMLNVLGLYATTVGMHYQADSSSSFHYFNTTGGGGTYCPVKGGAYTNASSEKLKTNVKALGHDPVQTLHALAPVTYELKQPIAQKTEHMGFVVEQLKESLPHAVWPVGEDEPEDASESYDVVPIVATLTHALQQVEKRVQALEGMAHV